MSVYNFRIKTVFATSLPPVVCNRAHVFISGIYVCLRTVVTNVYCVVFLFVCLRLVFYVLNVVTFSWLPNLFSLTFILKLNVPDECYSRHASCVLNKVREIRRDKQKWTIQRHWKHGVHKTHTWRIHTKHKTTQKHGLNNNRGESMWSRKVSSSCF